MDNQSKKTKLIVIALIVSVIMVVAVSFAFFSYSKFGQNNLITTGVGLSFSYTEEEALTLINQFPKDAQTAISESDRFNFKITGSVPPENDAINYEIYAKAGSKPNDKEGLEGRFKDSEISLYLNTNAKSDLTIERDYGNEQTGDVAGNSEEGFLLASGIINSGESINYDFSLIMWLNETVTISDTEPDATYCAHENIPATENDEGLTCASANPVYSNLYYSLVIEVRSDYNIQSTDKSLKNTILTKAYQDKEIIAINNSGDKCEDLESCEGNIREYRYSGPEVNNYVKLKNINSETSNEEDELWRIIGVFTDEETEEQYIRLVRNEVLLPSALPVNFIKNGVTYKIQESPNTTDAYWNNGGTNNNDFSTAGLQYYLNEETDESGNKGYMSYLSEDTKSMLAERIHYLGAVVYDELETPMSAYQHERDIKSCIENKGAVSASSNFPSVGCNVWQGNAATWPGKISLMYESDYGLSASSINWNKSFRNDTDGFKNSTVNGTSWMYNSMPVFEDKFTWFISPSSIYDYQAAGVVPTGGTSTGAVNTHHVNFERSVQPVLNLKSEVVVESGTGTEEDAYVLGLPN